MSISGRIHDTLESWQAEWKDRLSGWMSSWAMKGIKDFLEDTEPGAKEAMRDTLTRIRNYPSTPPEIQKALDDAMALPDWEKTLSGWIWYILGILPAIMSSGGPLANLITYDVETLKRTYRLDPIQVISAWLRDKPAYEGYFNDLKEQGWSDDRLGVLKELAKILPPLADMVRFADFGSFDPEIIELWREFYNAPSWISEPMSLLGITNEPGRDWANKYWFSHWRQPGRFELGEIYRRGLLGTPKIGQEEIGGDGSPGPAEELVKNAYLTQGFSSFWQDHLLQLVREIPTRVDVRRWWDMRTIDETELRSLYQRHGYFGKDLENYVVWTKVYVAFPDLMARWTKGWITIDDVRSQLTALGMPAARVEEMIQTKIAPQAAARVDSERDVTKTDIYKGVKQGVITRGEAVELLIDLGFSEDEADYLLAINIPSDEEDVVVEDRKLSKADILKGLKVGEITRDGARLRLMELRYSATDAELILKIYDAQVEVPTEPKLREASKADIVLGVTKGLIDQYEGYMMLLDLGFTPEAADFILFVKTEESPFSPINFPEFKAITQKYKIATGREEKPMPEELVKAAEEVVKLTGEVEALERSIEDEKRGLIDTESVPEETTRRLKKLEVAKNRAISELERVKLEYNSKLAEWRHGV